MKSTDTATFSAGELLPVIARMMTVLHRIRLPSGDKPSPDVLGVVGYVCGTALARTLAEDAPPSVLAVIDPLVEELVRQVRSELLVDGTRN